MGVGRFVLCLHSHMPYVLGHGKSPHGEDWLYESAAECYLPLLRVLDSLLREEIRPRWTVGITPILAEQLEDERFKAGFEAYCRAKMDAAMDDCERFEREGQPWLQGLAEMWRRTYERALHEFVEVWRRSIVGGFRHLADQGCIEPITSAATHGYLPLIGTDEGVRAQVRLGVQTYERHFGRAPRGFWLPECAYRPEYDWSPPVGGDRSSRHRIGVEVPLREAGLRFFFVDAPMLLGGAGQEAARGFGPLAEVIARGPRFAVHGEPHSEYERYALPNGVSYFARDPRTAERVWSGEIGYPGDEWYLEFHKHLPPGRLRYWRISPNKADLGAKLPYDPYSAYERIEMHAEDMARTLRESLAAHRDATGREGTLVAMYDTELFGHWWWEGPEFLAQLARKLHRDGEVESVSGGDMLDRGPEPRTARLPEGSWGESGHHSVWLNGENRWMWERLYPSQERMRALARTAEGGASRRFALQAARELLLAEASDWPFLITAGTARDYAEDRFWGHMQRFDRFAEVAERLSGTARASAEEESFLSEWEKRDAPFADLDLGLWR